eukprot:SAG31_NODE_11422_length_1032_cov_1.426581_1_plen_47_part_00
MAVARAGGAQQPLGEASRTYVPILDKSLIDIDKEPAAAHRALSWTW